MSAKFPSGGVYDHLAGSLIAGLYNFHAFVYACFIILLFTFPLGVRGCDCGTPWTLHLSHIVRKRVFGDFRPGKIQTSLLSYRN